MTYETIILEKEEGIATITLHRPERLNAYTTQMGEELVEGLERVDADRDVRVVVITGAGRAFCSGADVKDNFLRVLEERKRGERGVPGFSFPERGPMILRNMAKPVIASINGPAVGIGFTLAVACDMRIASENATLGAIFVRVGLTPEFGSTYNLTRLVGIAKACELVFTGKMISAKEAKEMGLLNQVVPADELKAATHELVRSIAQWPPIAIQIAKRGLYQGLDNDLAAQLQFEAFGLDFCRGTQDHEEGAKAFLEKRQPRFEGR